MKTKLLSLITLGAFLISFLDIYRNPHFLYERLHIHSQLILAIAVGAFLFGRFVLKVRLSPLLSKLLLLLAFLATPLAAALIVVNGSMGANFVYSLTKLNMENLLFVGFCASVVSLSNLRFSTLRAHSKLLVTLFPLLLAIGFFLLAILPQDFLKHLTDEDGVIETMQTVILFVGSFGAFLTSQSLWSKKRRLYAFLFLLLSVGMFFVAGEEIAWGQRILGITTPQSLKEINNQNEITLHNVKGIHDLMSYVYFAVAIGGTLAPLIRNRIRDKFLLPSEQLTFFFALGALYYTSVVLDLFPFLTPWPEIAEVFLYAGAAAFMFEAYATLNPHLKRGKIG